MASTEILRLHYYERQYLGASDLEDQQSYLRDMRRRHNVGHHTWGIVTGLELMELPVAGDPTAVDVFVQPGMAIDEFGREIIVMAPVKLDSLLFDSFANQQHRAVWISYDQQQAQQPTAGFAQCDATNQFGRILETYKIEIDPKLPTYQDVTVNGKMVNPKNDPTIPSDQSVPYQEFPDDMTDPLCLIRLGSVNWDGVNRKFIPASPHSRLMQERFYAGVVAQTLYSAAPEPVPDPKNPDPSTDAPQFFIQPRFPVADPDAAGFAEVVGRLQVDGRIIAQKDVLLYGGQLQFFDSGGQTQNIPLWMQRTPGDGNTGTDLHVHLGDSDKDATTRLSIGPKSGTKDKAVLAVKADDTVDITTGSLSFGSTTRQMLNLWKANYGVGVQNGTLYFRSDSAYRWYQGGKHANDPASADNGTLLLSVDGNGSLSVTKDINLPGDINFGSQVRQMLNLWDVQYGIGVQAWTLYFRTHGDFCWFRDGVHSDTRDDPGGGVRAMMLDSNSKLTVTGDLATQNNLSVSGNAGIGSDLNVSGNQNLIDVFFQTLAIQNNGNNFATWVCNHPNRFSKVYAAFAVFQGFSLFGQGGNTSFNNFGHVADVGAIPQHAFVRVDSGTGTEQTTGTCFCSEASAGPNETDNTILFTVVVIGKPLNAR